jgi:tRNA threonylcarbamoyladenosine biosynthesis protein TsaE
MQVKETVKEICSAEEMFHYGTLLARTLAKPPFILAIKGDLGAGKTTFLKGFISALTEIEPDQIQSPTFTYLQVYNDYLYHFDLYRIKHYEQFESAGFADYLHAGGICCIEWAERIEDRLPSSAYVLEIAYLGQQSRRCSLYQRGSL